MALINGFPYGTFHRAVVKADVYAPDWRDEARVGYTLDLVEILGRLLPPDSATAASRRRRSPTRSGWPPTTIRAGRRSPPTSSAWLPRWRRSSARTAGRCTWTSNRNPIARSRTRTKPSRSSTAGCCRPGRRSSHARWAWAPRRPGRPLLDHVRVCVDCCHAAVEYDDPVAMLGRLAGAGIGVGRIQLEFGPARGHADVRARRDGRHRQAPAVRRLDLPSPGHRPDGRRRAPALRRSRRRPGGLPRRLRRRVADSLSRAALHAGLRGPRLDAGRCGAGARRRPRGRGAPPSRDRDVHLGRAPAGAEDRPPRFHRPRVPIGFSGSCADAAAPRPCTRPSS